MPTAAITAMYLTKVSSSLKQNILKNVYLISIQDPTYNMCHYKPVKCTIKFDTVVNEINHALLHITCILLSQKPVPMNQWQFLKLLKFFPALTGSFLSAVDHVRDQNHFQPILTLGFFPMVHEVTVWKCVLELQSNHPSQMKS